MAIEIVVPRLGWSMEEGVFGEWLKQEGELVKSGDMLFVLEGEKASQEIESFDSGLLRIAPDAPKPGETVKVGQLLAFLVDEGELAPFETSGPSTASKAFPEAAKPISRPAGPAVRRLARQLNIDLADLPQAGVCQVTEAEVRAFQADSSPDDSPPVRHSSARRRPAATPRARRVAKELNVDWSDIAGSGRNGRICERDIRAYVSRSTSTSSRIAAGRQTEASAMRRTIAQRMFSSAQQTAAVTLTTQADADGLVRLRERLKHEKDCVTPSYNDLLVKLTATALDGSLLNACWRNDGVFLYDEVNIALAIDTEGGLYAPVIKKTTSLSLEEITRQSRELAERARQRQLSFEQLQGGTFTITNLGMFDIDFFTPLINLPQTAILGVGRITREPVVVDDAIEIGHRIGLSLTFDHRVLDGAPAARWLQTLSEMIAKASC